MWHIERSGGSRKVTWWTLLGLLLVPLLIAVGLFVVARPSTTAVSAAVVNLDEAVTINGKLVPLGRQLSSELVGQEENVTWTLADLPSAEKGLANGRYSVVVVIPKNFSAAATSFSGNDAHKAIQATIDIRVGENSPVSDAVVAQQIARVATDLTNRTLTESYLDNIYLGFNTVGEQFTTVIDGARKLADGGAKLDEGLGDAVVGARQLADGAGRFAEGMPALVNGIKRLSDEGAKLTDGVTAFADGAVGIVGGVDQLGKGARAFESQVRSSKTDYSELAKLKDGASKLAAGASALSGGVDKISAILRMMTVAKLPDGGPGLPVECPVNDPETCKVFYQVMKVLGDLATGKVSIPPELFDQISCPVSDPEQCKVFNEILRFIKDVATSEHPLPDDIVKKFVCPVEDKATCLLLLRTYLAGFQTGTGVAYAMLNVPDPASGTSLRNGAAQLSSGAKRYAEGITRFVDELPKQAAAQQKQLADGIGKVAAGAETIVAKSQPLVANASKLSGGARQFKVGLRTLAEKVTPLPGGANQLATGARSLADGLSQARTGATKLSDGLDEFATKLAEGADKIPYYSATDRAALKKVVTRPIATDTGLLKGPAGALMAVLLAIGLWLGSMATYLVVRAIPSRVVTSSRPTWQLSAATLAPGLALAGVQAVLLGVLAAVVVPLPVGTAAGLIAVLLLAGAAFVAVNHAALAWARGWGRFVLLALAVLATAAGLTSGVPSVVSWLAALSPVTPTLTAVRSLGTGTSLTEPVGALLIWLFLGLVAGYVAIARKRQLKPSELKPPSP